MNGYKNLIHKVKTNEKQLHKCLLCPALLSKSYSPYCIPCNYDLQQARIREKYSLHKST